MIKFILNNKLPESHILFLQKHFKTRKFIHMFEVNKNDVTFRSCQAQWL